jgi:cell division protein ZapA (FtsZ GTPase activity inhibitor)
MSPPRTPVAKGAPGATLDVTILGREFTVACEEAERADLNEAVAYLDRQMRDIRDRGKVTGVDRIAVMAALNIAHDLLRERKTAGAGAGAPEGVVCSKVVSQQLLHPLRCSIPPNTLWTNALVARLPLPYVNRCALLRGSA